MDKQLAAEKIRALLKARIARLLGCDAEDLPFLKTGSMVHFLFLLGDAHTMPGFECSISALLDVLGSDIVWAKDVEKTQTEGELPKVVIN